MAHPYRSAGRAGAKTKFKAMLGTTTGAKHMNDDSVDNQHTKVTSGVDDVKIMGRVPPRRLDRARGGKVGKKGVTVNVIVPPANPAPPPIPPMAMKPPMPPPAPAVPPPGMKPPMPMGPTPGAGLPMQRKHGGKVKRDDGGRAGIARMVNWPDKADKDSGFSNDYHGTPYSAKWEGREPGQDVPLVKDQSRLRADGGRAKISKTAVKTQAGLQGRINAMDPTPEIVKPYANPDYVPKKNGGYIGGEGTGSKLKQWAQYSRKNSYHKKNGGGIGKYPLTAGADSGEGRLQHSKAQGKRNKD